MQIYKFFLVRKIPINWYFISGIIEFVSSTLAVSNIRNRTYTNYEVYLIGYGYGKFKEKIHFME